MEQIAILVHLLRDLTLLSAFDAQDYDSDYQDAGSSTQTVEKHVIVLTWQDSREELLLLGLI